MGTYRNSFSFISFSSPFLAQMCGHNLCNLQSALPRCAPRVLSISAGRGGARLAFRGAGQPVFPRGGVGRASLVETPFGRMSFEHAVSLSGASLSDMIPLVSKTGIIIVTFSFHLCQSISVIILFPEGLVPLPDSLQNDDDNNICDDADNFIYWRIVQHMLRILCSYNKSLIAPYNNK